MMNTTTNANRLPSIAQCLNRMHELHARALRGERPTAASPMWALRGYDAAAKTLRRWGAMDGATVTDRGRELLAAWEARYERTNASHQDA